MNTCTLTITSDEADDSIYLEVDYSNDVAEINKVMNIVSTFTHQLLSSNIPNELIGVIMALGKEVNVDVQNDDGVANEN